MRIAWFTPFRKVSAIGRFSQSVTNCLAKTARVDLWLAEPESEELHDTGLQIISYLHLSRFERFLAEYDLVVYNMGDQAEYHGAIYSAARLVPGVVILHDYVMHHFFAGYYEQRNAWQEYADAMARWYGADIQLLGGQWGGAHWRVWETDEVLRYPLFEQAIVGSQAVIVHADFVRDRVARIAAVPVEKIHLAYTVDRSSPVISRAKLGIPEDRLLIVTVGNANENKRIHVVLQALADNPELAQRLTYVVLGKFDGPFCGKLNTLRRELNLEDTVKFMGYANADILRAYLKHADLCVNLRWPAMEGGSASCAEQMLFGKPVIVTDTGIYSELPDDCVRKVRPDHETEDLVHHLHELVGDNKLRNQLGAQAARFAEKHFSPAAYAGHFLEFCGELPYYRPAYSLTELVGRELKDIGVTPDMAIVETVSRESALLLDGEYAPPILRDRKKWAGR